MFVCVKGGGLNQDNNETIKTKRTRTLWNKVPCLCSDVLTVFLFISFDGVSTSEYSAEDCSGVNTTNLIF